MSPELRAKFRRCARLHSRPVYRVHKPFIGTREEFFILFFCCVCTVVASAYLTCSQIRYLLELFDFCVHAGLGHELR